MNMKKIISLGVALVMSAAVLTACGGDGNNKATTAAPETQTTEAAVTQQGGAAVQDASEADDYTFVYKGTAISMKADAAPILEALGKEKSYTEETSCAFDGLDKNYTYPSFILTTYPDGDTDRINSITLLDDTVSTTKNLYINDSKDKVEELYDAEFNGVNAYIMNNGESQLTIIVDPDSKKVSSIQYAAVFE